jgi:glycosyltransferase involved in cell wall biosynthesis
VRTRLGVTPIGDRYLLPREQRTQPMNKPVADTIVCFSVTEWTGLPHNSRHLMLEAARRGYRVIYVDPLGVRSLKLQRKDMAKIARRLRQMTHPLISVADGVWRLAPLGLPLQGTCAGKAINRRLLALQIRLALRKLAARRVLLWSYSPQLLALRSSIHCDLALYYRTDAYPAIPNANSRYLESQEAQAAALADLCIAANQISLSDLPPSPSSSKRLVVPNAVDLSVFGADSFSEDTLPNVGHPRLLVIGAFDSWMDTDLLHDLMTMRPEWSLVLAGDRYTSIDALTALPNVHYLGRLPYERLPEIIGNCDIGLVPFRVNPFTTRGNPGKIFQYLAVGLPVLCTPFLDSSQYSGHIKVVPTKTAVFAAAIDELLSSNSSELANARKSYALKQTWSARFDAIESALAEIISEAPGTSPA